MKNHQYIKQKLTNSIDDIEIDYYPIINSTNDYLLDKNFTSKYHLCYADVQTKARGQRGQRWVSKNNDNVYLTLGFRCYCNIADNPLKSIKVALGVLEVIKQYLSFDNQKYLKIKLPNDIYFKHQKLAGILIETKNIKKGSYDIIIGVGINVNMLTTDENIDCHWTSLAIINGKKTDCCDVIVMLVKSIIRFFDKSDLNVLPDFHKHDYLLNKKITFNYANKSYQGIVKGLSADLKLNILNNSINKNLKFDLTSINKIRLERLD